MSRAKAQPLPSLVGEGQGWGQYLIRYQDITYSTPPKGHPQGSRGEWLARQFEDYIDFLKWTQ